MRYIWDQQDEYIKGVSHIPFAGWGIKKITPWMRKWDIDSAKRVDQFICNSSFVADRSLEFYNRQSKVIHPPIETERFKPGVKAQESYFLCAGAFVSYKRMDMAIAACESLGKKLILAGSGPMESKLRSQAGANTQFIISPDDKKFDELLQQADALLFPGVEDFGMIAIEAMASGTPVIAYEKGGAMDFIENDSNGIFFKEPSWQSLAQCITDFDPKSFDPDILCRYADNYSTDSFIRKMRDEVSALMENPR